LFFLICGYPGSNISAQP